MDETDLVNCDPEITYNAYIENLQLSVQHLIGRPVDLK